MYVSFHMWGFMRSSFTKVHCFEFRAGASSRDWSWIKGATCPNQIFRRYHDFWHSILSTSGLNYSPGEDLEHLEYQVRLGRANMWRHKDAWCMHKNQTICRCLGAPAAQRNVTVLNILKPAWSMNASLGHKSASITWGGGVENPEGSLPRQRPVVLKLGSLEASAAADRQSKVFPAVWRATVEICISSIVCFQTTFSILSTM